MKMWHGVVVVASLAATVGLTDVTGDWIIHPAGEPERVIAPPADVFRTRHITTLPEGWVGLLPVRWRGDRYGYDKIVSRADIGTQLDEPCIRRTWNGEEEIVDLPMAPLKDDKPDLDQVTSVTTSREYLELAEQGMISALLGFRVRQHPARVSHAIGCPQVAQATQALF